MTGEIATTETTNKIRVKPLIGSIMSSFGIGVFGFAGLITFLSYYAIAVFHEYSRHPYLYKFLIVLGFAYLTCLAGTIALWIVSLIKSNAKLKNVGISVLCVIAGCVAGFFLNEAVMYIAEFSKQLII